jgi:hypothetical protein
MARFLCALCACVLGRRERGSTRVGSVGTSLSVFGGSFQGVAALAGNGDRAPSAAEQVFFAPQDWKTMERRILMNEEG